MAGQQVARVLVGDRERVAVDPITGPELALEVRGPQIVRRRGGRWDHAGVMPRSAPPMLLHEAVSGKQISGRAGRGPRNVGMARLQPLHELFGPPVGVLSPRRQEELRHRVRDLVRTRVRRATPVLEGWTPAPVVARQPLVAGLGADGIARAELGHVVEPKTVVVNESFALFHGYRLQPGHRPTSR